MQHVVGAKKMYKKYLLSSVSMKKRTDGYRTVVAHVVTAMSDQVHKQRIKLSAIQFCDHHIFLK